MKKVDLMEKKPFILDSKNTDLMRFLIEKQHSLILMLSLTCSVPTKWETFMIA